MTQLTPFDPLTPDTPSTLTAPWHLPPEQQASLPLNPGPGCLAAALRQVAPAVQSPTARTLLRHAADQDAAAKEFTTRRLSVDLVHRDLDKDIVNR